MSDYRDDTHETAIAHGHSWGGQRNLTESLARGADRVFYALGMLVEEQAAVTVAVQDRPLTIITEAAAIQAAVVAGRRTGGVVAEVARAGDGTAHRTGSVLAAQAAATDTVRDMFGSLVIERATVATAVLAARAVAALVEDRVRAGDLVLHPASSLVVATAEAADTVVSRLRRNELVQEAARARTEPTASRAGTAELVAERGTVRSTAFGALAAGDIVVDMGELHDRVLQAEAAGGAWTANAGNWATSRYAPYAFDSLVVVDGVAYGAGADGVYALSGGDEGIEAVVVYGALDLSGGVLVHPLQAHLQYELDGTAEMEVRQTQTGQAAAYVYSLPAKLADALTSGRFVFGRGLRGRHFEFALRLKGRRARITDLSVEMAPSKRRV